MSNKLKKSGKSKNINTKIPNKPMSQPIKMDNSELNAKIKAYKEEKSPENFNALMNLLTASQVLIPAAPGANGKPAPRLMKTSAGDAYLGIFTDPEQLPDEEKKKPSLLVPYLVANKAAVNPVDDIKGIAINPFTDNLIISRQLLERVEEVEKNKKEAGEAKISANESDMGAAFKGLGKIETDENGNKVLKMNEKQYNQFERTQFEVGYLPNKLFTEGKAFIDAMTDRKTEYLDELYEDSYQQKRMYPYLPEDFTVLTLKVSDDDTVICIDMPTDNIYFGNAYKLYIAWSDSKQEGRYFRIVKGKEKDSKFFEEIGADKVAKNLGDAPTEGSELNEITKLIGVDNSDEN